MTYDEIKRELRRASGQLTAGDVAGARKTIEAMLGKGLSRADIANHFTSAELARLRKG
jgi:hypothetical protein